MTSDEIGNAIRAFRTANCPACDVAKAHRQDPFCTDCLSRLPENLRDDIVLKENFIAMFRTAMNYLKNNQDRPASPEVRKASK